MEKRLLYYELVKYLNHKNTLDFDRDDNVDEQDCKLFLQSLGQ